MDRAAIYMWGNWLGLFVCSCKTQKAAGHCTRNTKINKSRFFLLMKFVQHPVRIKKKSSHLLWLLPLNLIRHLWRSGFKPISRAFFIRGSTFSIDFVFFILFLQEQKILARKGRLLACDQKRKSPIGWDFAIQKCWEVIRKNLLTKRHLQRKNRLHFALLQH